MYRALYDYKTDLGNYLSFEAGDQFTVLEAKQKDWFLAQNGFGEIGYIPKNYVAREEKANTTQEVSGRQLSKSISSLGTNKSARMLYPSLDRMVSIPKTQGDAVVTQTVQHDDKVQLRNKSVRRVAPDPPSRISSIENKSRSSQELRKSASETTRVTGDQVDCNSVKSGQIGVHSGSSLNFKDSCQTVDSASSPVNFSHEETIDNRSNCENSGLIDVNEICVPDSLGNELVEDVRKNTGLSYQNSMVAVETVLGHIGFKVPDVAPLLDRIFATVNVNEANDEEEKVSPDFLRLKELFSELAECKDDSQQRSWALHEDEERINASLEELLSILENAKQSVAKKAIARDNYECVHTLVQYYQMEIRVPLRLTMLKVFNAMCVLDVTVVSQLLFSILTTELAEELQRNVDDIQRSSYVSLALAMLFSTGDPVPANLHDHLNTDFLKFVFDTIENPPTSDHEEHLTDLLVNFILAFNLHFKQTEQNLVMDVIIEKSTVKVFSEKILLLFNRGEDPVCMFDHEPRPPNSVMKLLQDMYMDQKTSTVIYTNDQKVLIDIILGHLVDLSPGDPNAVSILRPLCVSTEHEHLYQDGVDSIVVGWSVFPRLKVMQQLHKQCSMNRTNHLRLMQLFITNSDYVEHQHRITELKQCLKRIQDEEEESGGDKDIVSEMFKWSPAMS